ncbi:hypothetical protein [Alteromonas sp. BMJM2]|uniref:hypothetical protein n=1 Tax=Alteromonas sp. BMJM2 TaxID=2954241 RepID=UPI0022B3EF28|nr:hypothetical protein [Alteromonas sp. BMJM2]
MNELTVDEIKSALPDQFKKSINQELIDGINATIVDPEMYENYRDNLMSYTHVLKNGKFKVSSYLDAVRYVSYKLMGCTNIKSYSLTFPDKIDRFNSQGVPAKDIASYVTAYNKSKLVNLILEQTLIPSYILNQDLYQKALNTQAELMMYAKSEKVRSDAANSILTQLKMPEKQQVELEVSVKEDSIIGQLKRQSAELAAQQRTLIESGGANAQEVAHSKIIDADYEVSDD